MDHEVALSVKELARDDAEKERNEIIRLCITFKDIALIHRGGNVSRLRDGSEYWAENDWRNGYAEYIGAD